ncbi:adenosylcobinamide-GDP ribazoletransferase [Gordonia jacobaea]|uniref:adenosylcobinamide-GDP ribazoletransferase n=1 Tax=Gordonia jacobaea TaxID=122202 RepID=UPI003D763C3C
MSPVDALAGAFSWLTVVPIPVRNNTFDRRFGAAAIAAVPVVGLALGALVAVVAWALSLTDLPTTLIGILLVVVLGVGTRGMHLDGLADTADGLGCYGPPERVAEVMRSGSAGPFGVATIAAVMIVDTAGFAALTGDSRWLAIAAAVFVGRVATVIACRRSLPPARSTGFGALVAGTQRASIVVWSVLAIVAMVVAGGWQSLSPNVFDVGSALGAAITAVIALGFAWLFTRHCARRMGGINGDVLGAVIELSTAIALVGLLI